MAWSQKTSPYKFYQYWLNTSDEDASNFIRIFTLKDKAEIDSLSAEHATAPHLRVLQTALAKDITARVHSTADLEQAIKASSILFGNSVTEDLVNLDEDTLLAVFEGVPQVTISKSTYQSANTVTDLLSDLTQATIFPSKGEARKMIQGGGVSINKIKLTDVAAKPSFSLLQNKYLLAQKGKKNYYLIIVE